METKEILIDGSTYTITGLAKDDPYFQGIGNNFEPDFIEFCHRYIEKHYYCLDIGANIGLKTLVLAGFASQGRVCAIEPGPTIFPLLKLNLAQNKVTADSMNVAIGSNDGMIRFEENSAYGHITDSPLGIEIPSRSVASVLSELKFPRLDFVKIDVEGFEFDILRSSVEIFREHGTLVYFEFNSFAQIAFDQPSPKQFLEWLFEAFPNVYLSSNEASDILKRVEKHEIISLIHDNLLRYGCVNDFVVTYDPNRLKVKTSHLEERQRTAISQEAIVPIQLEPVPIVDNTIQIEQEQAKAAHKQEIAKLKERCKELKERCTKLKERYNELRYSKNYKLGRRLRKLVGLNTVE